MKPIRLRLIPLLLFPLSGCGTDADTDPEARAESESRPNILLIVADDIKGEGNAASQLGLSPSGVRSKMKRLGITRPDG